MATRSLAAVLAGLPMLRDLAPRHLELLAGCARNVRLAAGASLAREGQPADHFFLIQEGRVAVEVQNPGGPPITVQTVGPGEFFGWSWLAPPYRWRFDGRAVTATRALQFDGACLRGKCEADHELGYQFLRSMVQTMAARLEAARLQMLDLYGPDR